MNTNNMFVFEFANDILITSIFICKHKHHRTVAEFKLTVYICKHKHFLWILSLVLIAISIR